MTCIGGVGLVALGMILFGGAGTTADREETLYGIIRQARDLILCCLVVIGGYVLARAVDRLTQ